MLACLADRIGRALGCLGLSNDSISKQQDVGACGAVWLQAERLGDLDAEIQCLLNRAGPAEVRANAR
jgi:hypothetical protein